MKKPNAKMQLRERMRELGRRSAAVRQAKRAEALARAAAVEASWPLPDQRMPETAEECRQIGAWAQRELAFGRMDPRVAHELASLVRATLKAIGEGQSAETAAELRALLDEMNPTKRKGPSLAEMRQRGREALARKRELPA